MKKTAALIPAILILFLLLSSCGIANGSHGGIVEADSWPLTDYPEPEGAKVVSVEKNYNGVTVGIVWDDMAAAKSYAKILREQCSKDDSSDPQITETETDFSYSTYKFTVSYSEKEERLNYIHIY